MGAKMRSPFRGQIDAALVLPVLIGLLYAGTGNWSAERWNGALAIMGLGASAKAGFERGFATYNPMLRDPKDEPLERARDGHGRFIRREP
jgi:hypothetical protein